jgi:Carboxypeptidase regulatory-like domain
MHYFLWILPIMSGFSSGAVLYAQSPGGPNVSIVAAIPEYQRPSPTVRGISGVLMDPSGAAIPHAQVLLLSPDSSPIGKVTTDNLGAFRFDNLALGNYTLEFHADGFRDIKISTTVAAKHQNPLRVILPIAVRSETVTVATGISAPIISVESSENQNSNTINRDALDRVPVFDQDYVSTMSRFLDDNVTGTNGVPLVVNGIEANGPGVTASAVQEVRINQNPYSARFSRPGRARLEIVTKSGTSSFHGSLNFLFRDSLFDARNAFTLVRPPEHREYYEGSLTGPMGHSKRTTFLLALDEDLNDQQAIIDSDAIAAAESLGFSAGPQTVPNPTHHFFGSGRIFHDFANGDQAWIGYSYEHRSVNNQGVGGTTLASAGTNTQFLEHEVNVSHLHQFSPHWLNQLRFLLGHYDAPVTSLSSSPQVAVSGLFIEGGAQADSRRTEYHFDGTDFATFANGKHQLSFGTDIPDISRRGFDDFTNRSGIYTFAGRNAFPLNPSTYVVQAGRGHVVFLEKVFCAFVEDNIRLLPNFSLYLGMRYYFQNYFHDDVNNLAPRLGFAWAPSVRSKNVIRGGGGIFFDRTGPGPIADLLHFNGVNLLRFIAGKRLVSYPINPAVLSQVPTSIVSLDPRARIPYVLQYSIGIEHQLTQKTTVAVTYIGSRGMNQFRSIDANAPLPPSYQLSPHPNLGQVREMQSEGYLKGNSLELTFRGKLNRFFSGQVQYTLSKNYNNTSGITYFPAYSYDPNADWARSDSDRRHKFDLLASTEPTKFFTLGVALSLYSDKPVNVTTGADNNNDGIINDRPPGFTRNSMHGPGLIDLDLNLSHDFPLSKAKKEAKVVSISLNSFNVLNHTNDVTYVGVITSPFFGHAVAALPPRRTQLGLQFKF